MSGTPSVVWTPDFLTYRLSEEHPLDPIRLDLTMRLADGLGVLEGVEPLTPSLAPDSEIERIHRPSYLAAVKHAP
ncbi:MAG TPA: acetoin utilization protein AcuC, partial [Pseudonocardia sp.]|nr:acetoin utilization protein AcuC [Pseudonocardia sp.]